MQWCPIVLQFPSRIELAMKHPKPNCNQQVLVTDHHGHPVERYGKSDNRQLTRQELRQIFDQEIFFHRSSSSRAAATAGPSSLSPSTPSTPPPTTPTQLPWAPSRWPAAVTTAAITRTPCRLRSRGRSRAGSPSSPTARSSSTGKRGLSFWDISVEHISLYEVA